MTEEQIAEYIRQNLKVHIDHYTDYGNSGIEVSLSLEGKEFSSNRYVLKHWDD